MQKMLCAEVCQWLTLEDRTAPAAAPPQALCEHVAQCPACRGSLLLLMTELLGIGKDVHDVSCDLCQDALAPYIDLECQTGSLEAVRQYPEIWWHLWTCTDCAKTYRLTTTLLDSDQIDFPSYGDIPSQQALLVSSKRRRLHLPRSFLNRALHVQPLLGFAMGGDDELVVIDEEASGYWIKVDVRKQADNDWVAIVAIAPPVDGLVCLTLGERCFQAELSAAGKALISPIPAALLTALDGPDMIIELIPESRNRAV